MISVNLKRFPKVSSRYFALSSHSICVKNSLVGGAKELIIPEGRPLTWYSCGPTVYDVAHLGHARTYICSDVIRRIMIDYFKIDLTYALGMTDIDDKIINASKESNQTSSELARKFEKKFFEDMDDLNVQRPDGLLRVTEHIPMIIKYISNIIRNGFGYVREDGVYFNVSKMGAQYGKLGRRVEATVNDGSHISENSEFDKMETRDFALWKLSQDEPLWESPWGRGRPGWHIECSAMTDNFFGSNVDIHSGGVDLQFPHHTNEIAQCEAHNQCNSWVHCWLHMGHLHIEGRKMSKSLKNFISIRDYLSFNWTSSPAVDLRIYFLQHKYHSTLHFSKERIIEASILRRKFETFSFYVNNLRRSTTNRAGVESPASVSLRKQLYNSKINIKKALEDDFNTPVVINILSELVGSNLQWAVAALNDLSIQIDALMTVDAYVMSILEMLGIDMTTQHVQKLSKASLDNDSLRVDRLITSYVKFRSNIRDTIMPGFKKNSNVQQNDDSIGIFKKQLQLCDWARDDLLINNNVSIMDNKLPPQKQSTVEALSSSDLQSTAVMWSYVSSTEPSDNKNKK